MSSYRIDGRYRAAISPGVQQRPSNPAHGAQPCPKSPTAVQRALHRPEHSGAADRGSRLKSTLGSCSPTPPVATTARRAGLARALYFGASSTCPRSASPNGPLLAGGSSPADSRGPSACCRSATGRRVLGADPSKRPSARRPPRLAGEPAHRSATRPGRHRTPPHTRARCAVPATAPGLLAQRHPRTTARGNVRRHHRYPVAPHRHRTGSTRNSLALTVSGAHSHTRTTLPNTNLPSPDIAGLPSPPRRSRSPPANSTLPPSVTC